MVEIIIISGVILALLFLILIIIVASVSNEADEQIRRKHYGKK